MHFTYAHYEQLLNNIHAQGFEFASYFNWQSKARPCILRHDVDFCLQNALPIAEVEAKHGIKATYFVLLCSEFYNVFNARHLGTLKALQHLGHDVGLHFDEQNYPISVGDVASIKEAIRKEVGVLSTLLGEEVRAFSFHRPSQEVLSANIEIDGLANSYGNTFFKHFTYFSDSRRRWRHNVQATIENPATQKLHLLTHPFWWRETEVSMKDALMHFVQNAKKERFVALGENFTNLHEVMREEEVLK